MNKKFPSIIQHLIGAFSEIPFNQLLGLSLDHLDADHAIMSFPMKPKLVGNFVQGILYGGVISSVLDMAGGMVVMASAIEKHAALPIEELADIISKCSTVDLNVNYLRPGKSECFIAKSWLLKSGNHISFTRMELLNEEESLIASASGTYLMRS